MIMKFEDFSNSTWVGFEGPCSARFAYKLQPIMLTRFGALVAFFLLVHESIVEVLEIFEILVAATNMRE